MANQVVATLTGRFGPALAERAVRRVQPRDPPKLSALKPLSMRAIAEARHLLSAKYHRLDHIVPPPVLDELMVSPEMRALLSDPEHLRLLLSPSSRRCRLNLSYAALPETERLGLVSRVDRAGTKQAVARFERRLTDLTALVLGTAKESIRCLEVGDLDLRDEASYREFPRELILVLRAFLLRLLAGLAELHELSVLRWPGVVTDHTLNMLAQRHTSLTRLVVRYQDNNYYRFSEASVRCLASRCSLLEELELTGPVVKRDGFSALLPLLPALTSLTTSKPAELSSALYRHVSHSPQPLRLDTKVQFTYHSRQLRDRAEVVRVFASLPNVTDVAVQGEEDVCVGLTEIGNQVEYLELHLTGRVSRDTQSRLLERFAPTLLDLVLYGWVSWDLDLIARHCPALRRLKITGAITGIGEDFEVSGGQLNNLITCKLVHRGVLAYLRMPDVLLRQVLSSSRLRALILIRVSVPGHVVTQVCEQASRAQRGPLSSLEYLNLGRLSGLSAEHVVALMCHSPRLRTVELKVSDTFLGGQESDIVEQFCHTSLRGVSLSVSRPEDMEGW